MKNYENCPVNEWNADAILLSTESELQWDTVVNGTTSINPIESISTADVISEKSPDSILPLHPNTPTQ